MKYSSFAGLSPRIARHSKIVLGFFRRVLRALTRRIKIWIEDGQIWAQLRLKHRSHAIVAEPGEESHILYVLHNALPFASGGYANRAQGLAEGLAEADFRVTCVTRPGFPSDLKNFLGNQPREPWEVGGVRYRAVASPSYRSYSGYDYIVRASRSLESVIREERPSVVIGASNYLTALPALLAAKRCGVPFIYEVRGFWEITRASRDPSFLDSPQYREMVRRETLTAKEAELVVTLGGGMKQELENRGVSSDRIVIAPNAVTPSLYDKPSKAKFSRTGLHRSAETLVIGYVGTFVDYEGLHDLLRACEILVERQLNFHLLLVGSDLVTGSFGTFGDELKRMARSLGLSEYVTFEGRLSPDEARSVYSVIDVCVLPRLSSRVTEMVTPLKPLEAFAGGAALVAADIQPLREISGDGSRGLLFESGDFKGLADILTALVEDPERARSMAKIARRWTEQHRTWGIVGSGLGQQLRGLSSQQKA